MRIDVEAVSKRFGDFTALEDVTPRGGGGLADRAAGPERLGQVDAAADHRGPGGARRRDRCGSTAPTSPLARPQDRGHRLRVPALRGVRAHERARERGLRAADPQAPARRDPRAGRRAAGAGRADRVGRTAARASSRAASGSGWRWLARWRSSRGCCCWTSRSARWTRTCGPSCARWLRRLHDEQGVTTVLVTHDQEEAMEVADTIAVMNAGRIEQVGSPREVYDAPGQRVRDGLRRAGQPDRRAARAPPRRDASRSAPADGAVEAMVSRRRAPRIRGADRARAARRRGGARPADPRPDRGAGARRGDIVYVRAAGAGGEAGRGRGRAAVSA